jgi:hypothetical protein
VRLANRDAMRSAISDAVSVSHADHLARMQSMRDGATNAFYSGA